MVDSYGTKIMDKYSEDIEFYNTCREYYLQRVEATKLFKIKALAWADKSRGQAVATKSEQKSSLEASMATLRKEMSSLMDLDLSLMKQMLTLNEAIEEIKAKRLYAVSKDSLCESSGRITGSDVSVTGCSSIPEL